MNAPAQKAPISMLDPISYAIVMNAARVATKATVAINGADSFINRMKLFSSAASRSCPCVLGSRFPVNLASGREMNLARRAAMPMSRIDDTIGLAAVQGLILRLLPLLARLEAPRAATTVLMTSATMSSSSAAPMRIVPILVWRRSGTGRLFGDVF